MIDGEAVLILSEISEINVLNGVGSRVFELSDGTITIREIVQLMSEEYDAPPEQIERDVVEFVQKLVKHQVLVLGEEAEG